MFYLPIGTILMLLREVIVIYIDKTSIYAFFYYISHILELPREVVRQPVLAFLRTDFLRKKHSLFF